MQMIANRQLATFSAANEARENSIKAASAAPAASYQNTIRPLFGKGPAQPPDIGDHPDFRYLKGTDQSVNFPITTLFMDMEGSTRLNLLYPLEKVHRIKNAFITAAIEIVQSFDGHVHRIMGDAVMAYFGGVNKTPENAAIDAVNAASLIRYFVEHAIIPNLKSEGLGDSFGIRIGLDHGKKDDVLWSSYGYPGTNEVTATSFYVDAASKLQHAAGRNQIMIGQSLRGLLDFPQFLTPVKSVQRDGRSVEEPFLLPNLTDRTGASIDYRQYIWDWAEYLKCTPIGMVDSDLSRANGMTVTCEVTPSLSGPTERNFWPAAEALPKWKIVRFQVQLPMTTPAPRNIRFSVRNHGLEAEKEKDNGNHEEIQEKTSVYEPITYLDGTTFRGLHYLEIEVSVNGVIRHSARIGVYVS